MAKLLVANWKMNPDTAEEAVALAAGSDAAGVVLCPPFPFIRTVGEKLTKAKLGAQDIFWETRGAYTGEVSAPMLREFGVRYAIVGHSERRQYHGESDALVADKAKAALAHGITPIVCVGETLAEREANRTEDVVKRQLAAVIHVNGHCISEIVVAYEPVWAIGTGEVATPDDAQQVCKAIRSFVADISSDEVAAQTRVIYGGSVKARNIAALMTQDDVDGALVGGASIDPEEFSSICRFRDHVG